MQQMEHRLFLTAVVSECLRSVQEQMLAALSASGQDPNMDFSSCSTSSVQVSSDGQIQLYVYVASPDQDAADLLAAEGLRVESICAPLGLVQGWASWTGLDALAELPGVQDIAPPLYAMSQMDDGGGGARSSLSDETGSVVTAGDSILRADELRSLLDTTGEGVRIGVISSGADSWQAMAAEGELPTDIQVSSFTAHQPRTSYIEEGTAMMEIIHDIAPDAQLYFSGASASNGVPTTADLINGIQWLTGQGPSDPHVNLIVDDLNFCIASDALHAQPYFEDGPVAQVVADAVAGGVTYVSSAGNFRSGADTHWQGQFVDGGSGFAVFGQDDGLDDISNSVLVPPLGSIQVNLEWSDQWGYSGNDYDVILYDGNNQVKWTQHAQSQNRAYPWETLKWTNSDPSGGAKSIDIRIQKSDLADSRDLELFLYQTKTPVPGYPDPAGLEYQTGDALALQQAVESVITVGAIDSASLEHDATEPFSSAGPSTIYTDFDTQESVVRQSLDVCGIDDVVTRVGQEVVTKASYNPFFGTSAAAAHVAGIIGLILQAHPSLTPSQVSNLLTSNAVDILDAGYDSTSGYGRVDAMALVTSSPTAVDLVAGSDTGSSNTDDLTRLDNTSGKTLQFDVFDAVSGATIHLYADGVEIGNATASGTTTRITTDGDHDLADGAHSITATQVLPNKLESPASSALTVTVDTSAPTMTAHINGDTGYDSQIDWLYCTFSKAIDSSTAAISLYAYDSVLSSWGTCSSSDAVLTYDGASHTAQWDMYEYNAAGSRAVMNMNGWYVAIVTAQDVAGNDLAGTSVIELCRLAGDFNCDKKVTFEDYILLEGNFGRTDLGNFAPGDGDLDGFINFKDYILMEGCFGQNLTAIPAWV